MFDPEAVSLAILRAEFVESARRLRHANSGEVPSARELEALARTTITRTFPSLNDRAVDSWTKRLGDSF